MKLQIKYMVSNRCKVAVKYELKKMGLHPICVDLGEVEILGPVSKEQRLELKKGLQDAGFELIDSKRSVLIEKIKTIVIEMVHHSEESIKRNFSDYLSEKTNRNYTYLANLFSESEGMTIEQFVISHKIERIKELILYDELNISEIAWKMNYCSVAHLSYQFKKITGLSPSQYKNLKIKKRRPLESVGLAH